MVGVSASQGGTSSEQWQPSGTLLPEAINRFNTAKTWLELNGYRIANKFMVWCQGETDGDNGVTKDIYKTNFSSMATDGLMKDAFHYTQSGYNITGADAGINIAFYINTGKEPSMYDWEYDNLYYSKK